MTKAALVARLKKEYAAEDYFTGVLGSRASAFKPGPKPQLRKTSASAKTQPGPPRAGAKSKSTRIK